jgi:hypothetical protein
MTALSACQSAISRLVAVKPDSVFASTDEICVEIASLANEAATDIMKANDWQALTKLKIITGDGVTADWPLPDDYDRMVNGQEVHSGTWTFMRYMNAGTLDYWQDLKALLPACPPGYWIILQNKISFLPTVSTGNDARFYYVSNKFAASAGGAGKAAFDRDDDTFVLQDRLLTLALIWRWKSMKGNDYQEDMRNYDIALSQAMARDKGSRVIRSNGGWARGLNTRLGWPWELG